MVRLTDQFSSFLTPLFISTPLLLQVDQLEALEVLPEAVPLVLLRMPFPESPVMTSPSMLKYLRLLSSVMDRLMEVTMLILKLIVKLSTSVPMMEKVV